MNKLARLVVILVLILLAVWFLLPPLLTFQTSFMKTYAFINPIRAIQYMSLANWQHLPFNLLLRWGANSLFVCTVSTAVAVIICVAAGFGFAKFDFPAKEAIFGLFLLGMMIPITLLFLPRFLIIQRMGFFDSYFGMILPMLIYPPGIFFARQYISHLPDELLEAARIDGASDFQILRYVIVPLCLPLVAILSLFIFVYVWQQFMWQFIIVRNSDLQTLIVGLGMVLRGMTGAGDFGISEGSPISLEGLQAAGSVILALPPLVIFLIGQKYFVSGLVMGAVKE